MNRYGICARCEQPGLNTDNAVAVIYEPEPGGEGWVLFVHRTCTSPEDRVCDPKVPIDQWPSRPGVQP